ncbi:hypothetical protein KIW84_061209 [Lathyrus oleraceus]|uniref:Uncharacterized protein n=1 Tax=Pisum sativum TaxID=3888 RepID=A0A9D4W4C9_PEA|nr:hypothetical protein KIW84_061209 [Pisum sativum]
MGNLDVFDLDARRDEVWPVPGEAYEKDHLLQKYLKLDFGKLAEFKAFEINHVPLEENTNADVLSWLANTRNPRINHSFVQEIRKTPKIETKGKSVAVVSNMAPTFWMTLIQQYIEYGMILTYPSEVILVRRRLGLHRVRVNFIQEVLVHTIVEVLGKSKSQLRPPRSA